MSKYIIDCYNVVPGWLHILPVDDPDAEPLIRQYETAKARHGDRFHNLIPYNNSWWAIIEARNVVEATSKFLDLYTEKIGQYAIEGFKNGLDSVCGQGRGDV